MVMGYLSYIMIGLTIVAIVLFLTWYFLKSKKTIGLFILDLKVRKMSL